MADHYTKTAFTIEADAADIVFLPPILTAWLRVTNDNVTHCGRAAPFLTTGSVATQCLRGCPRGPRGQGGAFICGVGAAWCLRRTLLNCRL